MFIYIFYSVLSKVQTICTPASWKTLVEEHLLNSKPVLLRAKANVINIYGHIILAQGLYTSADYPVIRNFLLTG
jgi:hypothetical protein